MLMPAGYKVLFQVTKISDVSFQALSAELFRTVELFLEKLNTTLKSAVCAVCEYFTLSQHVLYTVYCIAVIPSLGAQGTQTCHKKGHNMTYQRPQSYIYLF